LHRNRRTAYLAITPAAILLLAVMGIPLLQVVTMAFSRTTRSGDPVAFDGIANFQRLLADPLLGRVVVQTGIWTLGILVPATILSLAIAIVLNRRFPGRFLARALVFAPWAVSFVFVSIVWRLIFDRYFGHLNELLSTITGSTVAVAWLGQPATAMPSVIWVGITLTIPFTTIVLLAGLQSIPGELLEAASIDGAGAWSRFRHVTLPLLQPVLAVATLVNLLYIFNSFPIIWTMTGGGPINATETFATYLYKIAFTDLDFGKSAALSLSGVALLLVISFLYVRRTADEVF
jgi:multiple sugar transport system permease protein